MEWAECTVPLFLGDWQTTDVRLSTKAHVAESRARQEGREAPDAVVVVPPYKNASCLKLKKQFGDWLASGAAAEHLYAIPISQRCQPLAMHSPCGSSAAARTNSTQQCEAAPFLLVNPKGHLPVLPERQLGAVSRGQLRRVDH